MGGLKPGKPLLGNVAEERCRIVSHYLKLWADMRGSDSGEDKRQTVAAYVELLSDVHPEDLEAAMRKAFLTPGRSFRPTAGEILACVDPDGEIRRERAAETASGRRTIPPTNRNQCIQDSLGSRFACGCAAHRPDLWCVVDGCVERSVGSLWGVPKEVADLRKCVRHNLHLVAVARAPLADYAGVPPA